MITLGKEFELDLIELETYLTGWEKEATRETKAALQQIGARTHGEAVQRVPVDTSNLKQRILWNVYKQIDEWFAEIGTNVREYPEFLEFGTEAIASGKVKQLGDSPLLTDEQAIHDWPAKSGQAIDQTSAKIGADGLKNASGKSVSGRAQEQMPWLRPAFNKNRMWAVNKLSQALAPPAKRKAI